MYNFSIAFFTSKPFLEKPKCSATMKSAIKIIAYIRGGHKSLTHRKFKKFLQEVNAEYGGILMFTKIRWLGKGKCLKRLLELRNDIADFLLLEESD